MRVAHRAVGEPPACDSWVEEAAAVATTLVDRHYLYRLEQRAQRVHHQLEWLTVSVAADLDDVRVGVD